jgi:small GTP-binding protein
VGKTSLIRRFVFNHFSDDYLTTIGTKITKKKIKVRHPKNFEWEYVTLMVWDIMGQPGFRHMLQDAYFYGAHGVIGVCDVTRKNTLSDLENWMEGVHNIVDGAPAVFLGNKCDLAGEQQVKVDELNEFASKYGHSKALLSSAKTGLNVDQAFKTLTKDIIGKVL